jgi:hypothetical protein
MTWTISHGPARPGQPFDGYRSRSYGQMGAWLDAVHATLSPADVAALSPLLTELGRRSADPFSIRPSAAAGLVPVLLRSVKQMPSDQRELTAALADAAQRAVDAGESWRWR